MCTFYPFGALGGMDFLFYFTAKPFIMRCGTIIGTLP